MMPRILLIFVGLVFLASASLKAFHGVPDYKVGGDLYAAFVRNEPWKHYAFLAVEFGLAFGLVSGIKRKAVGQAAILLLAALTVLLLAEFFFAAAPRVCGCFAGLVADRRAEAGRALAWSAVRNAVLLAVLGWAVWRLRPPSQRPENQAQA